MNTSNTSSNKEELNIEKIISSFDWKNIPELNLEIWKYSDEEKAELLWLLKNSEYTSYYKRVLWVLLWNRENKILDMLAIKEFWWKNVWRIFIASSCDFINFNIDWKDETILMEDISISDVNSIYNSLSQSWSEVLDLERITNELQTKVLEIQWLWSRIQKISPELLKDSKVWLMLQSIIAPCSQIRDDIK